MKKNNIDSIIKKESKNYREEVRPKLWDKLEKRMDDHYDSTSPAPKVSIAWTRYAAAFILLVGAVFLLSRLSTEAHPRTAQQFVIEEVSTVSDEDQLYKLMIDFSQKQYRPLVSSSDRM